MDPDYSQAHAALAELYWRCAQFGWRFGSEFGVAPGVCKSRCYDYLEMTMRDPIPLSYRVSSTVLLFGRQYELSAVDAQKAIDLDPNGADNYSNMAIIYIYSGRAHEAVDLMKKAMRLDPHYQAWYLYILGLAHFTLEQYEAAAQIFEKTLKQNPNIYLVHWILPAAYAHLGQKEKAISAWKNFKKNVLTPLYSESHKFSFEFYKTTRIFFHPYKNSEDFDRLVDAFYKAWLYAKGN
ncbi:MAG: tetratricopeptide repeat protein [Desulfobacterales bacterium]|nr:MAG: tetratricopeptide repeat protein [Desulfobacterales bacterium]